MKIAAISLVFLAFGIQSSISQNLNGSHDSHSSADKLGYLKISANVDSFMVVVDQDFDNIFNLASEDIIAIKEGIHEVRIIKKYYRDEVFEADIEHGITKTADFGLVPFNNFGRYKYSSSYPRIYWNSSLIIKGDPDANLYYEGKFIGRSFGQIDTTGEILITSELPSGEVKKETFVIGENEKYLSKFYVREFYQRPVRSTAKMLAFLPGANQIYQNKQLKGYALASAFLIGAGLAVKHQLGFDEQNQLFEETYRIYSNANDPDHVLELGDLADQQYAKASRHAKIRDQLIYGTAAVYLYSLIDGLIKPKIGYRDTIEFDPFLDFDPMYAEKFGLNARYRF